MKILIEGYYYDPAILEREQVADGLIEYHRRVSDGYVCYNYVGHLYSPKLKDYIFFLPKVVLEEKSKDEEDRLFGEKPEDIISITDTDTKLDISRRGFVCELAVWIYRALMIYRETHPDQNILLERNIAQIGSRRQRLCDTLLDIILELIRFNHENQDYVTFVLKSIHSGFNKIDWRRTISHSQAIIQDSVPIYMRPVNRKKQVNFDEELFIIYFSILKYISDHFGFQVNLNMGFELITGSKFKHLMDGYGRVRMRQIKYKYFSDKALRLWELCFAFFDKSHAINVRDDQKEYLLAQNFNIVFEAMIDELVGSRNIPSKLVEQRDGKRVDHMYTYADLVYQGSQQNNVQKEIYYIGDSKYYKIKSQVTDESVYKQYTYARNVIQWNLDLFLSEDEDLKKKDNPKNIWLRDETTEGYNIIPNFFISAFVDDGLSYERDNLKKRDVVFNSRQFENRLFDRDTLIITHYNVNFLYVLSLYARNNSFMKASWKAQVRELFRQNIQEELNKNYDFYAMTAHEDINAELYIKENFQSVLGKLFSPFDVINNQQYFSLALRNPDKLILKDKEREKILKEKIQDENAAILSQLRQSFYVEVCKIGESPYDKLPVVSPKPRVQISKDLLTVHHLENYPDTYFLIGVVNNDDHEKWIFSREGGKRDDAYNVRIGKDVSGGVVKSRDKIKHAKFVILYKKGEEDLGIWKVFRVKNIGELSQEQMIKTGYKNPRHDKYLCYFFEEEVFIGDFKINDIIEEDKHKYFLSNHQKGDLYPAGRPIYLKGDELINYRKQNDPKSWYMSNFK